jgi:hypothetical protein
MLHSKALWENSTHLYDIGKSGDLRSRHEGNGD